MTDSEQTSHLKQLILGPSATDNQTLNERLAQLEWSKDEDRYERPPEKARLDKVESEA